jgi:hypothetical protein
MLARFGLRQVGTLPRRSQRLTVERDRPVAATMPSRVGPRPPAQSLQKAAQHLPGAGTHVKREDDGVVDHHLRGQIALALARLAGLGQDLPHPGGRERLGDHAEADVVAETDAGGQAGGSTGHRCRSRKSRPAA